MAGSSVIVTKTVNRTVFEVDKASYNKTVRAIKSVKKQWTDAGSAVTKPKNDPAKQYDKSAQQMRLVNKRLMETRRREEAKASAHSIAIAKKEVRAKEAIQKASNARIKQAMSNMTAKNPEAAKMKKYYAQQEMAARKAQRKAPVRSGPMNIKKIHSVQLPARGGFGTGMVGDPSKIHSPETVARQNAQMAGGIRQQSKIRDAAAKKAERDQRQSAARAARIADVTNQQRIRLSSKYGNNYGAKLGGGSGGGVEALNRQFRQGAITAGAYRQSIQSLERQFRSAQSSAMSFGAVLGDVRSGLVGAGAAFGTFTAGASVLRQGQFFQGMDATMLMVSDSSEEAGKRVQFLKDQAYRLGLDLKTASQGYVQMSIAAEGVMSKGQNDDLFKSFSEYATALQVDPVKYQRGITAIGQMMGKGQVMAEELKGQLAEGIPGSMQVFVKASQEAFNDATIDVAKLMKMMEKGELKAAKIMPFVAKYYAEAARKGGALTKALEGNRVAMQRLGQAWVLWQNKIFEGGFGEQMTRVFNDLAQVLDQNGALATNLGAFFGNIIDGAWDMVTGVHNAFVLLDRILSYYLEKLGVDGAVLGEIFDWAAYTAGMAIFIGGLYKIFGVLSKIAGLKGAITAIKTAMGGLDPDAGPGKPGKKGGRAGPWNKPKGKTPGGWGGKMGGAFRGLKFGPWQMAAAMAAGSYLMSDETNAQQEALDNGLAPSRATQNPLAQATGGDMGMTMALLMNSLFGSSKPNPNINTDKLAQNAVTSTSPFPYPLSQQQVSGEITVKIEAGDLKRYIKAVVDENDKLNINMLIQGGQ